MNLLKIIKEYFYQDPYTKETKKRLKLLNNKIGSTKNYDEMVILCREYIALEQKLKEHKIKMKKSSIN